MIVPSRPFPMIRLACPDKSGQHNTILGDAAFFPRGRLALLHGMIRLGLEPGDAIIVPAYYCESALQAIVAYGFEPVFVDVGDDLQIPFEKLKAALASSKAEAVLLMHFFGFSPALREETVLFCRVAGIKIIEDYCHSFLSYLDSGSRTTGADACIFSVRKTLPVADGGALLPGGVRGDAVPPQPGSLPFTGDIPFLSMRMIESVLIRLGWPNLYGQWVGNARAVFARPYKGCGKVAVDDHSETEATLPSWSLMHLLCNEPYLRHVAQRRLDNYRKLAQALAFLNVEMAVHAINEGDIPQVLPVLDSSGTLADFLRGKGIGVYRWPGEELPAEVRSGKDIFPNAVRLNDSIVCLPLHQDISDVHIVFMVDAISGWRKRLSGGAVLCL